MALASKASTTPIPITATGTGTLSAKRCGSLDLNILLMRSPLSEGYAKPFRFLAYITTATNATTYITSPNTRSGPGRMSFDSVHNIVILTGAGVSAESGLATFRGSDGLWEGHRVEDVATPEAFRRDPALVHAFYNARRARLGSVKPNDAHKALARL